VADLTEQALMDAILHIRRMAIDNAVVAINPTKIILGPPWLEYCEQRGIDPIETALSIMADRDI